jgi:hypothetical protein
MANLTHTGLQSEAEVSVHAEDVATKTGRTGRRPPFAIATMALIVAVAAFLAGWSLRPESAEQGTSQNERDLERYVQGLIDLVAAGEFPPEALRAIQPDNSLDFDIDGDGLTTDDKVVVRFDFDGDGKPEGMTESELQNEFDRRVELRPSLDA